MSLESLYVYSFLTIINSKFIHISQFRRESLHAGDVKKSQFPDGRLHFGINLEKKSRDREMIFIPDWSGHVKAKDLYKNHPSPDAVYSFDAALIGN